MKRDGKMIGLITIGQSPRADVVTEMGRMIGTHVEIVERGALDDLTLAQTRAYAPQDGMLHLCTRMRDGTEVVVGKEKLLPRIQNAVTNLNQEGVGLILLLCVGDFPDFQADCLIVQSKRVVDRCVEGLIGDNHRLGILLPVMEQEAWARKTFTSITPNLTVAEASPYSKPERLSAAAEEFKRAGCDLIVMYCMGFNRTLAKELRGQSGIPVILASSILSRVMAELLE